MIITFGEAHCVLARFHCWHRLHITGVFFDPSFYVGKIPLFAVAARGAGGGDEDRTPPVRSRTQSRTKARFVIRHGILTHRRMCGRPRQVRDYEKTAIDLATYRDDD